MYPESEWLEYTKEFFSDTAVFQFMGAQIVSLAHGKSTVKLYVKKEFGNTWRHMHGGCLEVLADFAMGSALRTLQYNIVTVESSTNFIAPVFLGEELTAYGNLVHEGHKIILGEVAIVNEKDRLVARGKATFMKLGEAVMEETAPAR